MVALRWPASALALQAESINRDSCVKEDGLGFPALLETYIHSLSDTGLCGRAGTPTSHGMPLKMWRRVPGCRVCVGLQGSYLSLYPPYKPSMVPRTLLTNPDDPFTIPSFLSFCGVVQDFQSMSLWSIPAGFHTLTPQ